MPQAGWLLRPFLSPPHPGGGGGTAQPASGWQPASSQMRRERRPSGSPPRAGTGADLRPGARGDLRGPNGGQHPRRHRPRRPPLSCLSLGSGSQGALCGPGSLSHCAQTAHHSTTAHSSTPHPRHHHILTLFSFSLGTTLPIDLQDCCLF